jgi:hypothetical protein
LTFCRASYMRVSTADSSTLAEEIAVNVEK